MIDIDAPPKYLIVDQYAIETLIAVIRADKVMLREVLRECAPYIYARSVRERAERAVAVTEGRTR